MFFRRNEKELKMIWEVEKYHKKSYLIGTAHFFPYSFKTSLQGCLKNARVVMFEGPLDPDSMAKVRNSGIDNESGVHIFDDLKPQDIDRLTREIAPRCRGRNPFLILNLRKFSIENLLYEMVQDMKPWLAFFTIWSYYLKQKGWKHSVDFEGYTLANSYSKPIVFLETIEEQIRVLETLDHDLILAFLRRVGDWPELAQGYVTSYLAGDLEGMKSKGLQFPSRHPIVINPRDKILYERMHAFMQRGDAVAFVGAPHVRGISQFLLADGFRITGPTIPA